MSTYDTPEEEWHDFLSGTHPHLKDKSPLRFLPSAPRCKLCKAPFGAPGAGIVRPFGFTPWEKNPKICGRCFKGLETHARMCPAARDEREVRGAEVELTLLFADVRGSSKIARQMTSVAFTLLMNRFYKVSREVLVEHDAIVEKFVGDEVVALFIPFMTGPEHAARAIEAARSLLDATGHGSPDGPWIPLGAGVHTGSAFVGVVGSNETTEFTALGDPVNVAAHLAAQAAAGEILATDVAAARAGIDVAGSDRRHVSLKGHPVDAVEVSMARPAAAS